MSPAGRPELGAHLVQLRARVDAHFDAAVARTPAAFACRLGCAHCCHQRFSVFEVEAAPLRAALAVLAHAEPRRRALIRDQGDDDALDHCALLIDGACAVYGQRPLICRSHGLPLAVPDEADPSGPLRVDHCPLNFGPDEQGSPQPPPRESLLILDAVNRPLSMLAQMWAPGDPRVELAALARADDDAPD